MSAEISTNARYSSLRDYYYRPHYFPNRTRQGLRDYYHYCFTSQTANHYNASTSREAANDARKPWLSTTLRERYYDKFSFLRKLRSIGQGKPVTSASTVECDVCDAREKLGGEINERTLEDGGWYFGPTKTLCPEHAE